MDLEIQSKLVEASLAGEEVLFKGDKIVFSVALLQDISAMPGEHSIPVIIDGIFKSSGIAEIRVRRDESVHQQASAPLKSLLRRLVLWVYKKTLSHCDCTVCNGGLTG